MNGYCKRVGFRAPRADAWLLAVAIGLHGAAAVAVGEPLAATLGDAAMTGGGWQASAQDDDPPSIRSRRVALGFQVTDDAEPPFAASVWFTTDGGRAWNRLPDSTLLEGAVRFDLPADGLYGLYLVLENDAGPSADAPRPGTAPQAHVRVDASPPEVQLLGIGVDAHFRLTREVTLRWRASDAQLANRPVAIHWRTEAARTFQPIAEGLPAVSTFRWTVPNEVSGRVEMRISARDLAGNVGQYVSDRLLITGDQARLRSDADAAASGIDGGGVDNVGRGDIDIGFRSPADVNRAALDRSLPGLFSEPDAGAATVSSQAVAAAQKRLELGTYHRLRGELDLAITRFREALKLDPNQLEAWHDLGGVLLLQNRLDDADGAFRAALAKDPYHLPSLRGLALVQARRGDYNSAARTLDALLVAAPDDVEALLAAGDVALFSGDRDAARRLWARAAEQGLADGDADARRRAEKRLELYPPRREPAAAP